METEQLQPSQKSKYAPGKIDKEKLIELAKTNLTQSEIAEILGATRESVNKALAKFNVKQEEAQEYLDNEKLLTADLTRRVYNTFTESVIKNMSDKNKIMLWGVGTDKLHAAGSRNNGVAIQINIAKPDGEVTVINSPQPAEPVSEGT
jgi:DNA-binding CsgD family transcriptional regulator